MYLPPAGSITEDNFVFLKDQLSVASSVGLFRQLDPRYRTAPLRVILFRKYRNRL